MNDIHGGETVRPTKKQREILTYIEQFIAGHGYSPSYREIMNGLNYTSVATVSLHVNSLIRRGHLRKRDRSARSLEVVAESNSGAAAPAVGAASVAAPPTDQQGTVWLVGRVDAAIKALEKADIVSAQQYQDAANLVNTLKILGLGTEYSGLAVRLTALEAKAGQTVAGGAPDGK
jgi:SOS-response transcriptional repressor LexA